MDIETVVAKRYWREADAKIVINAWRTSGLTIAGFARKHGCSTERIGRWAAHIATRDGAAMGSMPARTPLQSAAPEPAPPGLRFIELVRPASAPAPVIEVAVGRAVVRVPAGFDTATLQQIVAVLEASC